MSVKEKSKRFLIIGIIGCLLYVIGDFLFAATGKGQTTESIGFMVRVPCRCWVFSVLFGFVFAVVMRLIGNCGMTNALAVGRISIGNLWMMCGLLVASRKIRK